MKSRAPIFLAALMCALLAVCASASAKTSTTPVVSSISPMKLNVGEKLTVKGKNFLPGKGKTRVFFVRRGGGTAFARAATASRTKLVVIVPAQLNKVLAGKSARVQIRVLGKKFGKLTAARRSPVVSPAAAGSGTTGTGTGPAAPTADCDSDGTPNSADLDDDNDLLPDTLETSLGTDPCSADTDKDGVEDGYEYYSALDLNRTVLQGARPPVPYPAKRPYPNALFNDANTDFDGDGLTLLDEFSLWQKFGGHALPLNYSDGLQTTVPTPLPAGALLQQLDTASSVTHFNDGMLDDAERDADGDGLSNWDESHGRMLQSWWTSTYDKETVYPISFSGVDMLDPDTDGDGILDGADDQDHDGLSNAFEIERPWNWDATYISIGPGTGHSGNNPYARVQPYNPCKPVWSDTCHQHFPAAYYPDDEDWAGLTPAQAGPPGELPGPLFP